MTELGEFALYLAWGFAALGFFFGPIGKAIAKRIAGPGHSGSEADVAELRARVDELDGQQQRVAELEERLDCAERMLANIQAPQLEGRGQAR